MAEPTSNQMGNLNFELTDRDAEVLDVVKEEGRANPYLIRQRTEYGKGDVNTALVRLSQHGVIEKVTRGLYEFVEDPRDD